MNTANKVRLVLLTLILVLTISSIPVNGNKTNNAVSMLEPMKSFTPAAGGSEWLDCNAFDATYDEWTKTGADPYVDAQDEPTNLVTTKLDTYSVGWFDFPSTTLTGTLTVNISIYGKNDDGAGNDRVDVYVDFVAGAGVDIGDAAQHDTYSYDTFSVTGCDTVAEVNALRVYFQMMKVTAADDVYIDHVRIGVSSEGGGEAYEKDLTETVSVADVMTRSVDYDRTYTESVSVVDVQTTVADFVRNLVESIGAVGVMTMLRGREKDLFETITVVDVRTFSIDYARNLAEAVSCSDVWSKTFGLNRTEAISVIDSGEFSKFISKSMYEAVGVADSMTRSVGYSRNLTENITVSDVRTFSIEYVRNLVEAITVSDIRDIVKNPSEGTDYEKNLIEGISVSDVLTTEGGATIAIGSLFYQLFFSLNMWGYLGPITIVIIGYLVMAKNKNLGIIWVIVEYLIMAQYFALVEATPEYWWHIFILLIGALSKCFYLVGKRWR